MKYSGSYVALITPFKENLEVDYEKIESLVNWHIEKGTDGIVVCGTTGETATLSQEEYEKVIKKVVDVVDKRIKVVAGAGSNSTKKAIELTKLCKEIGVDAVLSVAPYYNKPTQRAIVNHFKAISEVGIDIILYNIPSRTGVNMSVQTTVELSKVKNIVGIKEATGDIGQMIEIINNTKDFAVFSGEDNLVLPMIAIGANGVISVSANILPEEVSNIFKLKEEERFKLYQYMYDIHKNMFIEGNPVTIKTAMKVLKLVDNDIVREPLLKSSIETENILRDLFVKKGLI